MNFPVWILIIFTYGQSAQVTGPSALVPTRVFWPYSYVNATNYIVKDEITCRIGAQDSPNQHGLCLKAHNEEDIVDFCGDKIKRPCTTKVPNDIILGKYGPIFWRLSENQTSPFKPRIEYNGRNPNP